MKSTIFILGPGGVGKSNLEKLFSEDIIKINPYRLRPEGPRGVSKNELLNNDEKDFYYANAKLKHELELILCYLGDSYIKFDKNIFWYKKSKTLIFDVRGTWQILPLIKEFYESDDKLAIAEIYVSILPHVITSEEFDFFGNIKVIILNPSSVSILNSENTDLLKNITRNNIAKRGRDNETSISKRIDSIDEEFKIWKFLLENELTKDKTIEFVNWQFPEYRYLKENASEIEYEATECLLNKIPELSMFLRV